MIEAKINGYQVRLLTSRSCSSILIRAARQAARMRCINRLYLIGVCEHEPFEAEDVGMRTLNVAFAMLLWMLPATGVAGPYDGKRVLHIDSYHQGNEWNDRIAAAVRRTFAGTGVDLRVTHLDTKRNPSEALQRAAALRAKEIIKTFKLGADRPLRCPTLFTHRDWDTGRLEAAATRVCVCRPPAHVG
jgi:hypothetical protein